METNDQMVQDTYRLARENNKMLRAMRRNAFIGGLFKLLFYAALIIAPLWLYRYYLMPIIARLQSEVSYMQNSGGAAQAQLRDLQNLLKAFQSSTPAAGTTTSAQ